MQSIQQYIWIIDSLLIAGFYFLTTGVLYLVLYKWSRTRFRVRKIQKADAIPQQINKEVFFSIITMIIYTIIGYLVFKMRAAGWTRVYLDIYDHSMLYFFSSILLMVLLHDTYFYWTHRFLHLPFVYQYVHRTHHLSVNPSPWASFAFHPLEAVVEAGIIPLIAVAIPSHPIALMIFFIIMIASNVIGHLGYEFFPKGMKDHPIEKWINSSTNHNYHHSHFNGNYGLYFTFWDRVAGTFRDE